MGCSNMGCLGNHAFPRSEKYIEASKPPAEKDEATKQSLHETQRTRAKQLLQDGNQLLSEHKIEKAIHCFKELIALRCNLNDEIEGFGCIEDQIGFYEHNPIEWFTNNCTKLSPYDSLSICFLVSQQWDSALDWYKKALLENPKDYQLLLGLGHTYFNMKQYQNARQQYEKVIEIVPQFDKPYQLIAFICKIKDSNNQQTLKWAEKCKQINSANFYASFIAAICETNLKKKIDLLKGVIKQKQTYGRPYNSLGNALKKRNLIQQSIQSYKKCIELTPMYQAPYNGLGNIYREKQMFKQAILNYQISLQLNPLADKSYYGLGNAYNEIGEYDKAIQIYKKGIEVNPSFSAPYYGIGIAYKNKQMMNESAQWLVKSTMTDPHYDIPFNALGAVYLQLEEYDKAIEVFNKMIELKGKSQKVYLELADAYCRKENFDKSLETYNIVLDMNPKSWQALFGLANLYKKIEQEEKALQYYLLCIQVNPQYEAAYYSLGKLYKNQKNYDEAVSWYEKCLEINPKHDHALNGLGNINCEEGQYDEAIEWYQRSIAANPEYAAPYYGLGNAYFIKNEFDKAIEAYQKCIKANPLNDHPYNGLGNVYKSMQRYDEALQYYQKCIEINPSNDAAYYGIGNIYFAQQFLEKAEEMYQRCIERKANHPLCLTNLGFVYLKMENFKEAFNYFVKAKENVELDNRLSEDNKNYLSEKLSRFQHQAEEWQTKRLTGFISEQDKALLNENIKNFEGKVRYLYKTNPNRFIDSIKQKTLINPQFLKIISIIFEDKFKLKKIQNIFQTVHALFQFDEDYFHVIPQIFCQYFWNQKFVRRRSINEIQSTLSELIEEESQKYSKLKDENQYKSSILVKNPVKLTIFPNKSEKINLFVDAAFFPSYEELYMQIKKINELAGESLQQFTALVKHAKKNANGFDDAVGEKIPKQPQNEFKVMIRIMQKMFKEIKDRKYELIAKLDKNISSNEILTMQSVLHEIVKVWTDEIDVILTNRMVNKIPTPCFISDLIRGKCYFNNVRDMQVAVTKIEQICQEKGYDILQFQNRLLKPQTKDVVLKIKIRQAVCEFQLALKQSSKEYHFIHCVYEIERSPLGCIFGSYLFLSKGFKYPFVQHIKDIAVKLKGKSSLKERVIVKKIQYILDVLEEKGKSILK